MDSHFSEMRQKKQFAICPQDAFLHYLLQKQQRFKLVLNVKKHSRWESLKWTTTRDIEDKINFPLNIKGRTQASALYQRYQQTVTKYATFRHEILCTTIPNNYRKSRRQLKTGRTGLKNIAGRLPEKNRC